MKEENTEMIDQRMEFLEKWLISASAHESRDSQQFVNKFLYLVQHDQSTKLMLAKNLCGFLQSHQQNLQEIFQYCLTKGKQTYTPQICQFICLCMDQKNQVSLSWGMEQYLINNLWRPHMQDIVQKCGVCELRILEYLSLKMRSLCARIRFEAVKALYEILGEVGNGGSGGLLAVVKQALPQMIEKQNYGKKVCYYRGVLLQVLEDQLCHIKKKGIELLGKAQQYLQPQAIRPLILYMLNDEHQAVRETCLIVLSQIPSLDIEKQDLSALLVCLKQNNTLMRSYTYQNLSHINVTSATDFRLIMERLFVTLSARNEDKKKIYIVCSKLGKKYPTFVLSNLDYIYKYTDNDNEQPNWKSLIYRARFLTVASIGAENWPASLPKYFKSHYLYIRDVLLYAFQEKGKLLGDINQGMTNENESDNKEDEMDIRVDIRSDWQLYQYVSAASAIVEGILKSIYKIILQWLQTTKLLQSPSQNATRQALLETDKLSVQYNTSTSTIAQKIIAKLQQTIKQNSFPKLREFIHEIREPQNWKQLQLIENMIFKLSSTDRNKVVISNIGNILSRSFIEFSNSSITNEYLSQGDMAQQAQAQVGYLRMSLVDFQEINDKMCYYRINIKCKQIRCFILYGEPPQFYITQPYTMIGGGSDWLNAIVN